MKRVLLFFFLIVFTCNSYSQNYDLKIFDRKIDSLKIILESNEKDIKLLQENNKSLNTLIDSLDKKRNELILGTDDGSIFICIMGSCLYELPAGGKNIVCIKRGDKVKFLESRGNYYFVLFNGQKGWILKDALRNEQEMKLEIFNKEEQARIRKIKQDRIENEKQLAEKQQKEADILKEQKFKDEQKIEAQRRKSDLIKRYGLKDGQKVFDGKIWIGMSKEMLLQSWGKPDDINRTVTSSSVWEQWVYGKRYVYLENNILTSWQD